MMCFSHHFCTNWRSCKEYGKDYSFDVFCDLLIRDQQKLLDKGNLGGKHQAHFLKGEGTNINKDRGCANVLDLDMNVLTRKLEIRESSNSEKDQKKNTFRYCGMAGNVEKTYWKKRTNLE